MQDNAKQRQRILEVLYQARAQSPCRAEKDGWLPEAEIVNAVGECAFGLSVLADLKQVSRSGYMLRITGSGVLACEQGQAPSG